VDARGNADFVVTSQSTGSGPVLEGELRVDVPDLSLLPKVAGAPFAGHVLVSAEGTADLGRKTLAARAHVAGGDLSYGAHSVEDVTVVASAEGTPNHPLVDVGVHASTIASGAQKIGVAEVRARVEPGAVTTFRDAHVDLVKDGVTLGASAERVQVVGSRVLVEGALVTGLGEPIHADFSRTESEIRVKVDAPSIDLERAAAVAGRPQSVRSGRLSLDGDVVLVRGSATGAVHARVSRCPPRSSTAAR